MKKLFSASIIIVFSGAAMAQTDSTVYSKFATAQNRSEFYSNLVENTIKKNLSMPLSDSTEENWQQAFYAMELIYYKEPETIARLKIAADDFGKRSTDFQKSFFEVVYANQLKQFTRQTHKLLKTTTNGKVFALCAEYLLMADTSRNIKNDISKIALKRISRIIADEDFKAVAGLQRHLKNIDKIKRAATAVFFKSLFKKDYLKGNTIVYSIQRKNRNYPGLLLIKDTAGNFITAGNGDIFSVPQLAKSLSNLPSYLTNGNTPQGIFRMYGFGNSRNAFIGPTQNLQLTMPAETSVRHFLKDSSISDTAWRKQWYGKLLPGELYKYEPLYESFYAGVTGRTEIIAHGTTVDPEYYKGQIYYPYTPTAGCLCTKEIWDTGGKLIFSDQQKLVNAIKEAGGADGYVIVIELDNKQKAVTPDEILPYLK
jgi:hypothetical protein